MQIQMIARYGGIALALALGGFVSAIGVLTFVFAPMTGAYAPVSSADAAAWIQAVGSIAAIIGSFWLGRRQAEEARRLAVTMAVSAKIERERAYYKIVDLLYYALENIGVEMKKSDYEQAFQSIWEHHARSRCGGLTAAFDALPLHELGSSSRILYASELRSTANGIIKLADLAASQIKAGNKLGPGLLEALDAYEKTIKSCFAEFQAAYPSDFINAR